MNIYLRTFTSKCLLSFVVLFSSINTAWAVTYTSIASGNWSAPTTWQGGVAPGSTINAADSVIINHVVNYNVANDLENRGSIRIETVIAAPTPAASLVVPGGRNVFNRAGATFTIIYGSIYQCRFGGCGNSGLPNSGKLDNEGGVMNVTSSFIEIAQDWTNLSGGRRTITDSCVLTGQNFSQTGASSIDTLTATSVSVGWHGSGNITYEGTLVADRVRFQLAGTSGSFSLNSGSVSGDIDYIYLKNHITGVAGNGTIFASGSVTGTVNLDAHFANLGNYIPNGKFTGAQLRSDQPVLGVTYFPDARCGIANRLPPQNSDMRAALGATTPAVVSPGQVIPSLTATCTNIGANGATNATCVPSVSVGVISALSCVPASPQTSLAAGANIVCTYTYTAPGTAGGLDEATTAVTFTATTSATNDTVPANNVATQLASVIDAVNDTASHPGGIVGATTNLTTNDQFPVDSLFTLQSGSTCAAPSVSGIGTATYNVPATGSCTVNYRVCAPAPNTTVCDTATLTVTATAPEAALMITKTDNKTTATSGGTNDYVVTLTNQGPSPANGVVVTDTPNPAGLTCPAGNVVTCTNLVGTSCPVGTFTFANLTPPLGITIVSLPVNSSLQLTYTCNVN